MADYIKIDRKILEWEWYGNINTKVLFLHCLLRANWRDGKFEGRVIERGSFVSSVQKLSIETELTQREVRTAIEHLKATGELTVTTTNKYSVFKVNNYCLYQSGDKQSDNQSDNQVTGKRQSNDKPTTTIEEVKKVRNIKEGTNVPKKKPPYYPNDEKLNQAFCDYVDMRKKIKKPMTDRAVELAMAKLNKLAVTPFSDAMDNDIAIKILNQSVLNGWQGLFELKDTAQSTNKSRAGIDWSQI